MKLSTIKVTAVLCLAWASCCPTHGQGTFQNLAFESANLPVVPAGQSGGLVDSLTAIPNWTAFYSTNQTSQILHNNYNLGGVNISILGPDFNAYPILQGSYSVLLQSGLGTPGIPTLAAIAQTGTVPASAQSLRFYARRLGFGDATPLVIALGGQPVPIYPMFITANYTVYGADVSGYAGQNKELRFSSLPTTESFYNDFIIDSIQFSNQPIPEPSAFGLVGLGALLFGYRVRRA